MRLRQFLSAHGITQTELANELGLAKPSVSLKLSGRRPWFDREIQVLLAFCRRYDPDVTYEDLFGEPEEAVAAGGVG